MTMALVTSSTGPINSLIDKLPSRPEFSDLRKGLEVMKQQMLRFCVPGVVTSMLAQQWLLKLREIAYDVNDWLDECLIRSGGQSLPQLCSPDDLAKIQEFSNKIIYAQNIGKSFGLLSVSPVDLKRSEVNMDRRELFLSREKPCLVGLGDPESKIGQHPMDNKKNLKVVCILGPGGIGKTTLAREVFRKHQNKFDCGAFVHAGQNPSIVDILMDIASQVMPSSEFPCDKKLIAKKLWSFLQTKSYFVVIDEIQSVQDWCPIRGVLPENDNGSRILSTTEFKPVANSCCVRSMDSVYLLQTLNETDSKNLLFHHESGSVEDDNIVQRVLKLCGGLPLALVVVAGMLGLEDTRLKNLVLSLLNQDFASEGISKILNMSYAILPLHIKSCFVYLSAFPANHMINKDRLIYRWIAEGFVPIREVESLFDTGEKIFNELARRALIQSVFGDSNHEPIGCTVHDVIHDFILSISREENFVTTSEQLTAGSYPSETIRRFAHDCSRQVETNILASSTLHLSRVRSFAVSGNCNKQMPLLSVFKHVRVLDLENARGMRSKQLRGIGSLLMLRYLGLKGSDITGLPKEIEALEHLSTLDIRNTVVNYLPRFKSAKLVSLLADRVVIPEGKMDVSKLLELVTIHIGRRCSIRTVSDLIRKSKQLRVLGVSFDDDAEEGDIKEFLRLVSALGVLNFLIDGYTIKVIHTMLHIWQRRVPYFERFEISQYSCYKIPERIDCLTCLTHLHIKVYMLEAEGLHALMNLPRLGVLHLNSHNTQKLHLVSMDCFICLRVLRLNCLDSGMGLQFGPGAMPALKQFELAFDVAESKLVCAGFDFGIQHLSCLEEIGVSFHCTGATAADLEAAKAAIKNQVTQNPNNPLFKLNTT